MGKYSPKNQCCQFENIEKKGLGKLSTTARDLFLFVNQFGKLDNVRDTISIYFLDDQMQKNENRNLCSIPITFL